MKNILEKIITHHLLTREEARQFLIKASTQEVNQIQLGSILTGIQMRGIKLEELIGFRQALLELCKPIEMDANHAIDLCGTGGDGKNTFNISTCSSLVLASMGYQVIKHGNYGVSSISGSSNVLEEIGIKFSSDQEQLNSSLQKHNICFLHAPLFHPALAKLAPIRKALGIPTLFNALGPLVNPVQPAFQLSGTFSLELAKMYQHVLREERTNFKVIYGMDGYDEISLTSQTRVLSKKNDEIINASNYGVKNIHSSSINGAKTVKEASIILLKILEGKGSEEQNHVIAATVCEAIHCMKTNLNRQELFQEALAHIYSGKSLQLVNKIRS